MGYNLAYFAIILALYISTGHDMGTWTATQYFLFGLFVFSVLCAKAQASVADTICDCVCDERNPCKSFVSKAANLIGIPKCRILMYSTIGLSLFSALVISYILNDLLILASLITFNVLGYYYSYPPRFKEKHTWNVIITSAVDVVCIVLTGYYIFSKSIPTLVYFSSISIFLYSASFHLMHMAGDIHEDKRAGVQTLATNLGTSKSLLISTLLASSALITTVNITLFIPFIAVYNLVLLHLYRRIRKLNEPEQCRIISDSWKIKSWALILNIGLALAIWIHYKL